MLVIKNGIVLLIDKKVGLQLHVTKMFCCYSAVAAAAAAEDNDDLD